MNTLNARVTEITRRNTAATLGKSLFATTDNMLDEGVLREAVRTIKRPTASTVHAQLSRVLFGSARFTAWLSDTRFNEQYVKVYRKMTEAKTDTNHTHYEDILVEMLHDLLATRMFTDEHMSILCSMIGQNFVQQANGTAYGKRKFWETVALMRHGTWEYAGVKRVPGWDYRLYTR